MAGRRVFPLSVDASASSSSAKRSQPPPPKSPVHRPAIENDVARPPTGGSIGFVGFDRLTMMRQVNAAAAPLPTSFIGNGGEEVSAAVNHRQRMAAEQQRRFESSLMTKEDYTGTIEGQERLQRQEERSRMREEELLVVRLVEAEKQAARALQREKELQEEERIKEQYLAKIRAQREEQEKQAKEKEAARKLEMEKRMKALKEAADAKARAEFAEKQHALEEEARVAREQHLTELETAQMQVEDVLGHAMQLEMIAERERRQQIAAEQEEWRLFQEREQEKQREATQLRRAAMTQQYEQDKQRRIQIHKLQKERAAQQLERREGINRQAQELQPQNVEVKSDEALLCPTTAVDEPNQPVEPSLEASEVQQDDTGSKVKVDQESLAIESESVVDNEVFVQQDTPADNKEESAQETSITIVGEPREVENVTLIGIVTEEIDEEKIQEECEIIPETKNSTEKSPRLCENENVSELSPGEEVDVILTHDSAVDEPSADIYTDLSVQEAESLTELSVQDKETRPNRPVWSISAARDKSVVPFAQVLSVVANSPALEASLQSGDLLVKFGEIVSSTPKCLIAMAEFVQKHVNEAFPVILLRPVQLQNHFEEVQVSLCPRKWKGKGLLGCQLSPFKWPEEEERTSDTSVYVSSTEDPSASDEGASALVIYDIAPDSIAQKSGLVNGDILASCDHIERLSVLTLSAVVEHIQAVRTSCSSVKLEINRWIPEDQCYRSIHVVLELTGDLEPLGFALTSFTEYYNYYSNTEAAASACEECYYTSLTTALHAAALSGHVACLTALLASLQNGDDGGYTANDYLDWRDEDGRTPLFYACYAGQAECVNYLVKTMESSVNDRQSIFSPGVDLYGDTVLHAATSSGNVIVISLLLESGCVKVDDRNQTHLTCAHVAPNVETLFLLSERWGADLLATDSEERMPLAYACLRNDVESIQYLCTKHPDFVDYADVRGNTPLHVTAWQGLQEAAEVLIHFLPSIALYITNEDGQNAAELARSNGMEEIADFLDSVLAAADSNVS